MEFIGFVALVLIGAYGLFAGIVINRVSLGFAGKVDSVGVAIIIIAAIILWVAWLNKPFSILIQ